MGWWAQLTGWVSSCTVWLVEVARQHHFKGHTLPHAAAICPHGLPQTCCKRRWRHSGPTAWRCTAMCGRIPTTGCETMSDRIRM